MKHLKWLAFVLLITMAFGCQQKPVTILCIGDSITEGSGLKQFSRRAYPAVLDSMLGPGYRVVNLGRGGATMLKSGDLPYWNTQDFLNLFDYQADIVIVMLGTNDTKPHNWNEGEFAKDFQAMIDTLHTLQGNPEIFVCKPVPVFKDVWGINDSTMVNGVLPVVEKLAATNNHTLIDLYTGMAGAGIHFPDGVHPDEAGARMMAGIVARSIKE